MSLTGPRAGNGAARVAAVLAVGIEVVLRAGVSASSHDLEAVRAVRPEVHDEAAVVPSIVRGCRNVVLSAHLVAADDAGQLAAGLREARREAL